jgi:hypothetical protein
MEEGHENKQENENEQVEYLLTLLNAMEERVRHAKEAGIQVPADEATKFARLDEKATPEELKKIKSAFDILTTVIMANGERNDLEDQGDIEFKFTGGHIEASSLIPNYQDPHIDAPSEKTHIRIDTDGRRDIVVDYDTKDQGVISLGVIFAIPEEEEIAHVAPFNTGETSLNDVRIDEAEIIEQFTTDAANMIDPHLTQHLISQRHSE